MTDTTQTPQLTPQQRAMLGGMGLALIAADAPDRPAVISEAHGSRTFGELNANANRLVRALRSRGLTAGDSLGLVCSNRPEFLEVLMAAQRMGVRITPINWHLQADEVAYILDDCEAKAFIADTRFAEVCKRAADTSPLAEIRLSVGGDIAGFASYEDAIGAEAGHDIDDPVAGGSMLYTSGTTGRPKGVHRPAGGGAGAGAAGAGAAQAGGRRAQAQAGQVAASRPGAAYVPGTDVHLVTGPAYHAAPLAFSVRLPLAQGVTIVLMDGWDPEETLRLIEKHTVTHTHMVPTMFVRLLALPEKVRSRYDVSSLRYIIHGAAPCPIEVKQALMDWLGPIVHEYYAATEGAGTFIGPEEWLAKPGSVGKTAGNIEIRDEQGETVAAGEVGTVYLKAPARGRFEYYKDPDKTSSAYRGDFYTLGDMGYLDTDGYLFLTGRSAEVIISGGVNIYPAEIDAVLIGHDAVADVACVGIPNAEWGEEVKAVVQLQPGTEASEQLAQELISYCRERLAHFKCPRSVDFTDELPRHDTGKIYRRLVRDTYWADAGKTT